MDPLAVVTELRFWLGIVGTVAFAVTAVIAVAPKRIDLFGVTVLGVITAVGGGTIRDVIIGVPVFWVLDQTLLWVALAASILAFFTHGFLARRTMSRLMLYLDGLGVAMFSIQAVAKVWSLEVGRPLVPILLGVVTAIGGGLIRDLLAGRPTLVMSRELYAVPVLLACILFTVVLELAPQHGFAGALACSALAFLLRAAAIHWELAVPERLVTRAPPER